MSKIVPKYTPDATSITSLERFEGLETFQAAGAIAIGDTVVFDLTAGFALSSIVDVAPAGSLWGLGVATTAAAAAGDSVQVQVRGIAAATVDVAVVAGDPVYVDAGVAGALAAAGAAGAVAVGVALGAGGPDCPVLLFPAL